MASTSIAPRPWSSRSARPGTQVAGLSRRQAFALVLLAACLWGTSGTAYHLLRGMAEVDALTVVALRASAGAALLWGWLAFTDRAALRVVLEDLPRLIAFGVGSLGLMYLALFTAFDLTSVAVGTVLLYLAPALVTIGAALFLHEPLTRRKFIALIATFGGCLLVVELNRPQNLVGNALGIAWSGRRGRLCCLQPRREAAPGSLPPSDGPGLRRTARRRWPAGCEAPHRTRRLASSQRPAGHRGLRWRCGHDRAVRAVHAGSAAAALK